MDVVVWLRSLGLEEYEVAFRDNKIDERVLASLTAEDLKEIGVGPVGHRRTLLEAIAALRADTTGKPPHGAELICGARNMPFSVKSIELSNWILWQFLNK